MTVPAWGQPCSYLLTLHSQEHISCLQLNAGDLVRVIPGWTVTSPPQVRLRWERGAMKTERAASTSDTWSLPVPRSLALLFPTTLPGILRVREGSAGRRGCFEEWRWRSCQERETTEAHPQAEVTNKVGLLATFGQHSRVIESMVWNMMQLLFNPQLSLYLVFLAHAESQEIVKSIHRVPRRTM